VGFPASPLGYAVARQPTFRVLLGFRMTLP
jgi:hypothetical protein